MSEKRFLVGISAPALAILICTGAGLLLPSYQRYVIAVAITSMLVGVALGIVVGLGRCVTLAAGSVTAIGAYTATLAMTRLGIAYPVGAVLAAITGAAAGWLIAWPGTRFRGHNLAMVTLVFQSVCIILLREAKSLTGGAEGMHVPPPIIFGWQVTTDADFLLMIGVAAAVAILLLTILAHGLFGKNLRAAAGNEIGAEAFGISVKGYLRAAFIISSAAIGFAGALAAPRVRILDPESYNVLQSIFFLAYPIVGGLNSVWGGILGGGAMRLLPEVLRPVADYQELFFATLVIIVVMFFPGGLLELLQRGARMLVPRRPPPAPAMIEIPPVAKAAPTCHAGAATTLLKVEDVDRRFGALQALKGAWLEMPAGGLHGLIGPNGAGKTSLFNIISGFLEADAGEVSFAGTELLKLGPRDRIGVGISRTFQHVAVFGHLSCLDNVIIGRGRNEVGAAIRQSFDELFGGTMSRIARGEALDALHAVGLGTRALSPAGALSLGDQRRLEIARAIVSKPKLILLDEPVSGVSDAEADGLRELLLRINVENHIAMLIIEHNIPFVARLCRRISVMGAGSIVTEGSPAEVLALPAVRQLYFGEDAVA